MVRQKPNVELTREAFIDLRTAFQEADVAFECFLDKETGRVIWCSDHTAPVDGDADGDEPTWVHASREQRIDIWRNGDGRFLEVPAEAVGDRWQDIQAFWRTADAPSCADRFEGAPPNRQTIRRFRRWLEHHPEQDRRWREFRNKRTEGRIRSWLRTEGFGMTIGRSQTRPEK